MWWWVLLVVLVLLLLLWRTSSNFTNKEIPRTIWTFWNSDTLPPIVEKSIDSWRKHSPDFDIKLITPSNVKEYIPDFDITKYKHADSFPRVSDFIRLDILAKYGGIWSDASIVSTTSHNWVIDEQKKRGFEFFGYDRGYVTTRPEYPALESWFFACIPNCDFVKRWRDEFSRINNFDTVDDYIKDLKSKNIDFQNIPMPEYLAVYLSAQAVMQTQMSVESIKSKLHIIKSDDGPFKHSIQNDWDPSRSMKWLCEQKNSELPDLIKIYGNERRAVESDPQLECVYKIFSPSLE